MKKLFVILFVVLISVGLYSETKVDKVPMLNDVNPEAITPVATDDVGDIIFDIDVEAIVADNQVLGVEYDGTYMWVTGGGNAADPNKLYKIDPIAGTLIATYDQPASSTGWGVRDLAWVESEGLIYGGNESNFYSFDPATEVWATVFTGGIGGCIRALAYDGNNFWTKSFGDPLYEFDVNGNIINTYTNASSTYGLAYDSFADCLWLFATPTTFVQIGLDGVPTGTSHAVTLPNGGIVGGAFYYEGGLVPGKTILGCLGQGAPDVVYCMELRDAAPLDSPGAPTGVTVIPDASGALEAEIGWTCPDVDVGGNTLTDLDEMRVYRDGTIIYTDTNPTIGGPGTYDDVVPASGNYAYSVVGFNDAGEGIPATVSTWIGEDVPNVVEDLLLEQTAPGVLSGTLTWINPSTGLNGGAFNEAILGYHIERNDGATFEETGLLTEFTDTTIPVAGTYYYTVQAYNSVGDGGIVESNSVLIADAGLLVMEDFSISVPPTGWEVLGMNPGNWSQSATTNAGGTAPEAKFSWTPSFTGFTALTTMPLNTTGATTIHIEYMHFLNDFSSIGYTIGVKTTSDGGATWNEAFSWAPTGDIGPELVVEDITTADVGSATCQIGFFFDGYSFDLDYYYIDDVAITMEAIIPDPGYIEGTVVIADGAGNVEDVDVEAGGVIVNPAADGTYSIELPIGNYDVTATLAGYDTEVIVGVIVTEGNTTSGVDFSLVTDGDEIIIAATQLNGNYPNPFNPVTTIGYSIKDAGNVILEVYNLRGQLVKTLVNEVKQTGDHTVNWNGTDDSNKSVSSGVYFYKMVSEGNIGRYTSTKKMILMK